jgi:hypothetical protein
MTPKLSAGRRLRASLEKALERASNAEGQKLQWSEQELAVLERACSTADRAEVIRASFDAEQDGEARPGELVKLSAELRALDKQVVDLVMRVNPELGPAKSERHQRAARSRWDSKTLRGVR